MLLSRHRLLAASAIGLIAAPAIVRADNIMKVVAQKLTCAWTNDTGNCVEVRFLAGINSDGSPWFWESVGNIILPPGAGLSVENNFLMAHVNKKSHPVLGGGSFTPRTAQVIEWQGFGDSRIHNILL